MKKVKTATRVTHVMKLETLRKGGAMERAQRSLKEIESDIETLEVEIFEANIDRYRRYGALLNEARTHFKTPAKFWAWAERKSKGRSKDTLGDYMRLAGSSKVKSAKTLSEATGDTRTWSDRSDSIREDQWANIIEKAKGYMGSRDRALVEEMSDDKAEGKRQTDLAQRVVTTGYKILAATMHPDKGGSQGEMARLNLVKQLLLTAIEEMAL